MKLIIMYIFFNIGLSHADTKSPITEKYRLLKDHQELVEYDEISVFEDSDVENDIVDFNVIETISSDSDQHLTDESISKDTIAIKKKFIFNERYDALYERNQKYDKYEKYKNYRSPASTKRP